MIWMEMQFDVVALHEPVVQVNSGACMVNVETPYGCPLDDEYDWVTWYRAKLSVNALVRLDSAARLATKAACARRLFRSRATSASNCALVPRLKTTLIPCP